MNPPASSRSVVQFHSSIDCDILKQYERLRLLPLGPAIIGMSHPDHPTAKVLSRVPDGDDSANVERLWAFDVGNDQYELDNLPFYA
jgi:hypothetical protein